MDEKVAVAEIYKEFRDIANESIEYCHYLKSLSERGVKYVDKHTGEPWLPDNVVIFPGTKEVH
jgi:hypothetical protein